MNTPSAVGHDYYASHPALSPVVIGQIELPNRISVSPMCTYSADADGMPNDFHLVHLGARALGGAGLVMAEMTAISPTGRISPGCTGLWTDEQATAWARIVRFFHEQSNAKIGIQLGHAGRRGATMRGWEAADKPLSEGAWPLVSASSIPWKTENAVPAELSTQEMQEIVGQYESAALRAKSAGFDLLEVHAAHGYLLSSFLSPVTNKRTDSFGGSLKNRLRFPLSVLQSVRKVWGTTLSVRISALDWIEGGNDEAEAIAIAQAFQEAGADLINVSTGQVDPKSRPQYGPCFQAPIASKIKEAVDIPVAVAGAITTLEEADDIVRTGKSDLVALARPHLTDPNWTLAQAANRGIVLPNWPRQYASGRAQLMRLLKENR